MRHVFRATKMGWSREQEGIWFDADKYTKEEAEAQFKPFSGVTERGYPYTGYEYGGVKYHDVTYIGTFENNKMPRCNEDVLDLLYHKYKN